MSVLRLAVGGPEHGSYLYPHPKVDWPVREDDGSISHYRYEKRIVTLYEDAALEVMVCEDVPEDELIGHVATALSTALSKLAAATERYFEARRSGPKLVAAEAQRAKEAMRS